VEFCSLIARKRNLRELTERQAMATEHFIKARQLVATFDTILVK
jgi:hypothetical protein